MVCQYFACALLLLTGSLIEAFSVAPKGTSSSQKTSLAHDPRSFTSLFASDEDTSDNNESAKPKSKSSSSSSENDILNSPVFLKRKLEVLKSDYTKAEEALTEAKTRFEEGKAEWGAQLEELEQEYKNIQVRMSSQSKKGDTMATVQVARQMLEVLDNFDRAFGAVTPSNSDEEAIEAEYKKCYDRILQAFSELGIEQVETVGTEFDYEYHQAIMQKPSDDYEEGIVCEEFQKGFKLDETLIRAAMVAVAA